MIKIQKTILAYTIFLPTIIAICVSILWVGSKISLEVICRICALLVGAGVGSVITLCLGAICYLGFPIVFYLGSWIIWAFGFVITKCDIVKFQPSFEIDRFWFKYGSKISSLGIAIIIVGLIFAGFFGVSLVFVLVCSSY